MVYDDKDLQKRGVSYKAIHKFSYTLHMLFVDYCKNSKIPDQISMAVTYSYIAVQNLFSSICFIKQKDQNQMDMIQYENAATLLTTRGIITTQQHFQIRYITLLFLKGINIYHILNAKFP